MGKLRIAVHKFTSCDGCQLAFINLGEMLLPLSEQVEFVHFPELGPVNPEAKVDVAFVEGSISTPAELKRIQTVRANSDFLITIGACATAGGIQALRNFKDIKAWVAAVYASPEYIDTLETSTAIALQVKVDLELWGCPVNSEQVLSALKTLLRGAAPRVSRDSVCLQCKRQGYSCVLVTKGEPCLGPVTQIGCEALCPSVGRACYGCYGPDENPNTGSLSACFKALGLSDDAIERRFAFITNQAPAFLEAANQAKTKTDSE